MAWSHGIASLSVSLRVPQTLSLRSSPAAGRQRGAGLDATVDSQPKQEPGISGTLLRPRKPILQQLRRVGNAIGPQRASAAEPILQLEILRLQVGKWTTKLVEFRFGTMKFEPDDVGDFHQLGQ